MSDPRSGRLRVRTTCPACGRELAGVTNPEPLRRLTARLGRAEAERRVRAEAARLLVDHHRLAGCAGSTT